MVDKPETTDATVKEEDRMRGVVLVMSFPIVAVWLILAFIIIKGAVDDPAVLDNIEGLLTALAVLTIPVAKIVDKLYDKWLG